MRQKYYVNDTPQSLTGDHEVHSITCIFYPFIYSKTYLGEFENCHDAVREAKKKYPKSDGCINCSKACHNR
ncbi:hypothetical protein SAMN05444266_102185 [Chitinophaga jiangningensis]|uniref:Uncharacterized protein n=1 Tax=Chitinophaga jiangningensis TaxID=1419482 RepID=A0A1M6Y7G3_9BACT|nr:hypothetical protein SAMN05444266_102185 [Chitinophaga jiangningensis]